MKISIKFSLASGKASDLPIRMRVGYAGLRLDLRTGFVCPPEKWDAEAMRMKPGTSNRYKETASAINRELSNQESIIGELLARYDIDGCIPEPAVLKEAFDRKTGRLKERKEDTTLEQAFAAFMSDGSIVQTSSTARTYLTAYNRLKDFDLLYKPIDEISADDVFRMLNEFWTDGLENTSVTLYLSRIKTVLKYAADKGWYHGDLHTSFHSKLLSRVNKKDILYLEWSEFKAMLYVQLADPKQIATRDAFCFCCVTGLRVSDCMKLRWEQVHLSCDTPHITLVTTKTLKNTVIELNDYARAIIDRQLSEGMRQDGLVFPPLALRSRNYHLHAIAKAAGLTGKVRELSYVGNKVAEIWTEKSEAISTHWARHTFIVHALSVGISPVVVMQWTGHASFESMKPYIAIASTAKKDSMALFND